MSQPSFIIGQRNEAISCGECGASMILRNSKYGLFWGCSRFPECQGTHGAHQETGAPLGTPADKETKEWRHKTHEAFDKTWLSASDRRGARKRAYEWLAEQLGIAEDDCHIGQFDIPTCKRVIELCSQRKA